MAIRKNMYIALSDFSYTTLDNRNSKLYSAGKFLLQSFIIFWFIARMYPVKVEQPSVFDHSQLTFDGTNTLPAIICVVYISLKFVIPTNDEVILHNLISDK